MATTNAADEQHNLEVAVCTIAVPTPTAASRIVISVYTLLVIHSRVLAVHWLVKPPVHDHRYRGRKLMVLAFRWVSCLHSVRQCLLEPTGLGHP
jgi:hypothetical protein